MGAIALIKRLVKGAPLTNAEGDSNWTEIEDYMNSVGLPGTAHDLNNYDTPGHFDQNTDAGAIAGTNYPAAVAGLLRVALGVGSNAGLVQTYTTYVSGQQYTRTRFDSVWSPWRRVAMDHGQCRFVYSSATECRLMPYNGNGLIINGRQYRIPTGGVAFSNSGLAANGIYYVFAKDDGSGNITLEAIGTGTTTRSTHTDGVEIRTSDPTRTLVGMVAMTASSQFLGTRVYRGVASWFNRESQSGFEVEVEVQTTATSYSKLADGCAILIWSGSDVNVTANGVAFPAGGTPVAYIVPTVNGIAIGGGNGFAMGSPNERRAIGGTAVYTANNDGLFTFALYGATSNADAPVTFRYDMSVIVNMQKFPLG